MNKQFPTSLSGILLGEIFQNVGAREKNHKILFFILKNNTISGVNINPISPNPGEYDHGGNPNKERNVSFTHMI